MSDVTVEDRESVFERLRSEPAFQPPVTETAPPPPAAEPEEAPATGEPEAPSFTPSPATYPRAPGSTVSLFYPFTMDGKTVRQITLVPPRMDYVRAVAAGDISRLDMIAEMAGLPSDVLGGMRWPDAERVLALAADLAPDLARG
jgi:hypothetical protein